MKHPKPSLLLAAASLALPLGARSPEPGLAERSFELALHVGATSVSLLNCGETPLALVLRGRADARQQVLVLPPHAAFEAHFTPSVLRGLDLIVVGRGPDGVVRSAPFALDALRDRAHEGVWFDVERSGVSAWVRAFHGEPYAGVDRDGRDNGESTHALSAPPPRHVPVITPHDGKARELPPRLERRALPPV